MRCNEGSKKIHSIRVLIRVLCISGLLGTKTGSISALGVYEGSTRIRCRVLYMVGFFWVGKVTDVFPWGS